MTEDKLLPCPFCGVALVERGDYNSEGGWNWFQHPEDSCCIIADVHISVSWDNKPIQCTKDGIAWNIRADAKTVKALVEAAQKALSALYNGFEPDNQSKAYYAVRAALKEWEG